MVADISHYVGREQAFVKHFFLESYLEVLALKTASTYDHIVYVDGFSGPWQSSGERFEDTSFGIALAALKQAQETWKLKGRTVRLSAHLVEQSPVAYGSLRTVTERFPDIDVHTYNGDFVTLAPSILRAIPSSAFAFLFIDPKGWSIDIQQLAELLRRPNAEVVFNFMFDFINRFASFEEPKIVEGLSKLIPYGSWREKLAALGSSAGADARKQVLADAFRETLQRVGDYRYVAQIPVLQRIKDRPLYSLFYGTRHDKGIQVFRGCHVRTELKQAAVRNATKQAHQEGKTRQINLFGSQVPLAPNDTARFLEAEKAAARSHILLMVPSAPATITYGQLWPLVLERHVVTKPDVNRIAVALRKEGVLAFPDWEQGKQVPDDHYRVSRTR